jgi:hypothetical protein
MFEEIIQWDVTQSGMICFLFACSFLSLLGDHEDGGNKFLRNVSKFLPHYTESHSKTQYFPVRQYFLYYQLKTKD